MDERPSDDPKKLAAQAAAAASAAADAAAITVGALDELTREVRGLRQALANHPTKAQVKRARWVSIAAVLALVIAGFAVTRIEANRSDVLLRQAFAHTCAERRDLEAVLRGILQEAAQHREVNEDAAEARHDRKFAAAGIKALTSPPCNEVIPPLNTKPTRPRLLEIDQLDKQQKEEGK